MAQIIQLPGVRRGMPGEVRAYAVGGVVTVHVDGAPVAELDAAGFRRLLFDLFDCGQPGAEVVALPTAKLG